MRRYFFSICIISVLLVQAALAQKPYRVGTTAANFLEIGFGTAGNAMGDAYVSLVEDVSAMYWNPAGLALLERHEAQFFYQPWIAGINTSFAGVGLRLPGSMGTVGIGLLNTSYGEMDVTTLDAQEGTGEKFNANEYSLSLSFARNLTNWFAFGASAKYINSKIWYLTARAFALDLGVIIQTKFLSLSGRRQDGTRIGMSISNYGTRMQYDGINLINPIDILPDKQGNFKDVPGKFSLREWELPLIFRIGVAVRPIVTKDQQVTLAVDALHTNNNSESVNAGLQYRYSIAAAGEFFLRGGYKALFMQNSEYGLSLGAGMKLRFVKSAPVYIDYAFRDIGVLGKTHSYSIRVQF